jgi:ubiquinone/menaquinone biosynthesis C-methylase UbiE
MKGIVVVKKSKQFVKDVETLKEAYCLEKRLAERIKTASREERKCMYNSTYAEYYEGFPNHPFIKRNEKRIEHSAFNQITYLKNFIRRDFTFLEVGSGTGGLSFEVAKYVKRVIMLDVSSEPTKGTKFPPNVQLIITNGVSVPLPENSVNLAYSNQLMEHLHPEDAVEQLKNIYKVLVDGGKYICVTPHVFTGPHDISRYFDNTATCLHIKEYTVTEVYNIFKSVGFRKVKFLMAFKQHQITFPIFLVKTVESILGKLPFYVTRQLANTLPLKLLCRIRLVGEKHT